MPKVTVIKKFKNDKKIDSNLIMYGDKTITETIGEIDELLDDLNGEVIE